MKDLKPFMGPYASIPKTCENQTEADIENKMDPVLQQQILNDIIEQEKNIEKTAKNTEQANSLMEELKTATEKSSKDIENIQKQFQAEIQARKTADAENRSYATKWNIISAAIALLSFAVAVVSLILQFAN